MVSKQFSYRLPDEAVEALKALQIEGETLNQTAQRTMIESLGLSTVSPSKLSTAVDIKSLVKEEVRSQLEELRGKLPAR